jgi:HlyD family secretion protein
MRTPTIGGLVALIPTLVLAACGQTAKPVDQSKTAITVAETPATTGGIASVFSFSGAVTPQWTVSVLPKAPGQVTEVHIKQGQKVKQGDVLAVLDHRALDDQLAQAKANVSSAQAKLDGLLAGARPEDVASANAQAAAAQAAVQNLQQGRPDAVAQAQAKLDADQAALNKLLNGPLPQDITNAQLAVQAAKDKMYADQTQLDGQVASGFVSKAQRQAMLDADQTAIDQAATSLAKLVAPPRAEDVAQAQAAVQADRQVLSMAKQPGSQAAIEQAQQQANAAKAAAAKAAKPYTAQDIAQARAAVQQAQASAQAAQTAVDDATITAPAPAVVSDVPVAVGSMVGATTPIATLISPDLEVDASVEESQVSAFKEGQPASISISGSSQAIDGKVLVVAPAADPKTRKFTVRVVPASADSPLRAGMSATVNIQTGEQSNAVLVPKDAVLQRNGQQVVFTDQGGRAKMTVVQTGASDDKNIQITQGIQPGDLVILPGSIDLADGDIVAPASTSPGPAQ